VHLDNPAEQLLSILEKGKDANPNENCQKVWRDLLDAQSDSEHLLLSKIGKVMLLPERACFLLDSVGNDSRVEHDHWVNRLLIAFSKQDLSGIWNTFIQHTDDHCLNYLRMVSGTLELQRTIKEPTDSELDEVRTQATELLDSVLASDLDGKIKRHLTRSLQRLLVAINQFSLFGVVPVIDALETTIGHAAAGSG